MVADEITRLSIAPLLLERLGSVLGTWDVVVDALKTARVESFFDEDRPCLVVCHAGRFAEAVRHVLGFDDVDAVSASDVRASWLLKIACPCLYREDLVRECQR